MLVFSRLAAALAVLAFASIAQAQSVVLTPTPIQHFVDNNNIPCVGCKLFVYQAGTTTKTTTYTDATGQTQQSNPIIMNTRGEPENGLGASLGIWLNPNQAIKYVLAPANDTDPPTNPFWTLDNINPLSTTAATNAALEALPSSLGNVLRLGFYAAGDAPAITYIASNSACSLNAGNGDGGYQVPTSDGKCWIATFPASGADFREWGPVGGQDSTTALNNAIAWAFAAHSQLVITSPSTPYNLSSQVSIGNGTSSSQSTLGGAQIVGIPTGVGQNEGRSANQPMMFKWVGSSGVIPFVVEGPIWRLTFSGITLDCNTICSTGFEFIHPIWSHFDRNLVRNYMGSGYIITAYGHTVSGLAQGAAYNSFDYDEAVDPVEGSGAGGITIGQASATTGDLDFTFSSFREDQFTYDGSSSGSCGITLQFTDVINFYEGGAQPVYGTSGHSLCVVGTTGFTQFPQSITFYNAELDGDVTYSNSWNPIHGISFYPFIIADNSTTDPIGPTYSAFQGISTSGYSFGLSLGSMITGNGGNSALSLDATTQYVGPACASTSSGDVCSAQILAVGQIRGLVGSLSAAPGSGNTVTFQLVKNNTPVSGYTCTVTGGTATSCGPTQFSSPVSVAAGDAISMSVSGTAGTTSAVPNWSVFYDHNPGGTNE